MVAHILKMVWAFLFSNAHSITFLYVLNDCFQGLIGRKPEINDGLLKAAMNSYLSIYSSHCIGLGNGFHRPSLRTW